jgi:hypothetical protein
LPQTAVLWPPIRQAFAWVHQAVHILNNHAQLPASALQTQYQHILEEMRERKAEVGGLALAIDQFLKITASFAPGLFHCDAIPDLPRTNNDLEHTFGTIRHHERRATGRPGTVPRLVVRGAVRVVAAIATRVHIFSADELRLADEQTWVQLHHQVTYREEARRHQFRFRKDPLTYLAALEARLIE